MWDKELTDLAVVVFDSEEKIEAAEDAFSWFTICDILFMERGDQEEFRFIALHGQTSDPPEMRQKAVFSSMGRNDCKADGCS